MYDRASNYVRGCENGDYDYRISIRPARINNPGIASAGNDQRNCYTMNENITLEDLRIRDEITKAVKKIFI